MTFQSCRKLKLFLFSCFGPQMPKYENSAPNTWIFRTFWKLSNWYNCLTDMRATSPQRSSNLVANSNYSYYRVLGPKCPNMEIWPKNALQLRRTSFSRYGVIEFYVQDKIALRMVYYITIFWEIVFWVAGGGAHCSFGPPQGDPTTSRRVPQS